MLSLKINIDLICVLIFQKIKVFFSFFPGFIESMVIRNRKATKLHMLHNQKCPSLAERLTFTAHISARTIKMPVFVQQMTN